MIVAAGCVILCPKSFPGSLSPFLKLHEHPRSPYPHHTGAGAFNREIREPRQLALHLLFLQLQPFVSRLDHLPAKEPIPSKFAEMVQFSPSFVPHPAIWGAPSHWAQSPAPQHLRVFRNFMPENTAEWGADTTIPVGQKAETTLQSKSPA